MKDVILVGAFHEVVELCDDCGVRIVGIIDKNLIGSYLGIPIIGTDNDAVRLYQEYSHCQLVITPDSPKVREKLFQLYFQAGFDFAPIISPKANISRSAKISRGTIIQSGVNVSSATIIGSFVKLNTNANVMHDNVVGDFATIAPNAVLLGYVHVGESSYIGANSTILPHIRIGSGSTVGAGAVVTKDVNNNVIVKGVPAK
jgi:sugar O-acyltransferase (sialic acid O-acetyltransferase NeuD family)